jgi:hypothetical protein
MTPLPLGGHVAVPEKLIAVVPFTMNETVVAAVPPPPPGGPVELSEQEVSENAARRQNVSAAVPGFRSGFRLVFMDTPLRIWIV